MHKANIEKKCLNHMVLIILSYFFLKNYYQTNIDVNKKIGNYLIKKIQIMKYFLK